MSSILPARGVRGHAEGEVDRSPTGTGVSGRLALSHARGRHEFVIDPEDPLGQGFRVR